MQRENRRALDAFQGLSPEQMHCVLYLPFASPDLVRIPEVLDVSPAAPILKLFCLLADAIGAQGLKPTAKGNLPRKVCREAALAYWGEETHRERTRFGDIHGEADFDELHTTRLVAELAGLIAGTGDGPVRPSMPVIWGGQALRPNWTAGAPAHF